MAPYKARKNAAVRPSARRRFMKISYPKRPRFASRKALFGPFSAVFGAKKTRRRGRLRVFCIFMEKAAF
jgi:hypothetical protein